MKLRYGSLWVITTEIRGEHWVCTWTLNWMRKRAIAEILKSPSRKNKTWPQLYREGYRCVRVDITPHGKAGG